MPPAFDPVQVTYQYAAAPDDAAAAAAGEATGPLLTPAQLHLDYDAILGVDTSFLVTSTKQSVTAAFLAFFRPTSMLTLKERFTMYHTGGMPVEGGGTFYPQDCPHVALARHQKFKVLRQTLTNLCVAAGLTSEPASSFDRWMFVQKMIEDQNFAYDPVLPNTTFWDANLWKELIFAGLTSEAAKHICTEFTEAVEQATCSIFLMRRCEANTGCRSPADAVYYRESTVPGMGRVSTIGALQKEYSIRRSDYDKLLTYYTQWYRAARLHAGGSADDPFDTLAFHCTLFLLLTRYDTVGGATYHTAVPRPVMELLHETMGVEHACFATPLNTSVPSYCSPYYDTDLFFLSMGSFFDFRPSEGAFESKPPFVEEVMKAMCEHMARLLDDADAHGRALAFFVTVPLWDDTDAWVMMDASPFKRARYHIQRNDHCYVGGLHFVTKKQRQKHWRAPFDSGVFVLQTRAAAVRWPIAPDFEARVREAFKMPANDDA